MRPPPRPLLGHGAGVGEVVSVGSDGEGLSVAVGEGLSVGAGEGLSVAVGEGLAVGVDEGLWDAVGEGSRSRLPPAMAMATRSPRPPR